MTRKKKSIINAVTEKQTIHIGPLRDIDFEIEIALNTVITLKKSYGPLSVEDVRIRIDVKDGQNWVVERFNKGTSKWEQKCSWFIQESYRDDEELSKKFTDLFRRNLIGMTKEKK